MMGKVERHRADLDPLVIDFLATEDRRLICEYLEQNSNLPGRRANLELARAFGDVVADAARANPDQMWSLCSRLTDIPASEAGVDQPSSFLPFCGAGAIGALGAVRSNYTERSLVRLRSLARDPRWRIREAVSSGLSRLLQARPDSALEALELWVAGGDLLEMRAAAAAVADPPLLQDGEIARRGLALQQSILDQVMHTPVEARKSEPFKILRKGLGFTLSVAVCAVPEAGFSLLHSLVDVDDRDVLWILRQNLKKKRLSRLAPVEVEALDRRL
jgi:hypothetical protein